MNYYAFHIGDYYAHTKQLSLMEDLAYRRMLDHYYLTESPLPDAKKTARAICMRDQLEEVQAVLDEFFTLTDEGYIHDRCEREIKAFNEKSGKAKASAQMRWSKPRKANAQETHSEGNANALNNDASAYDYDANALPTDCEGNAPNPNPNPSSHNQLKNKNNASATFENDQPAIDQLTTPPKPRTGAFLIDFDWQPGELFRVDCMKAGKDPKGVTDDMRLKFINHRKTKGYVKTAKEWDGLFLSWYLEALTKPVAQRMGQQPVAQQRYGPRQSDYSSPTDNPAETLQPVHKTGEYDDAVKNRVKPEAFKNNMANLKNLLG